MWKQITPADIERAKAAWGAMRDKILARHEEEIKILEMDENLLRSLEAGLLAFHQRFMPQPHLAAGDAETSPSPGGAIDNESPPSMDGQARVIALPSSPK